jgi:hypothetical protein
MRSSESVGRITETTYLLDNTYGAMPWEMINRSSISPLAWSDITRWDGKMAKRPVLTPDDIQERIADLNRFRMDTDDQACYWFGYQDGLAGREWIGEREREVTWKNLDQIADGYENPEYYKKGFEDAKGDLELLDADK